MFKKAGVTIIDINGKLMAKTKWNNDGILKLNVEGWPIGTYFVNIVTSTSEKITRKLIVTR